MAASNSWIAEATRTYFGNAAALKDFRVQMRGAKPFWVFFGYVFGLCLIGVIVYAQTLGRQSLSLANAQTELSGFFSALMGILAFAICLIAPGLTGSAIVAEKQRLSLDLVLTAPIQPKYFLVGKMISSYRYIWMLLVLALPVVALSVVLGGATWTDVFGCFMLLSFHAMIFTSMALLISSVTTKPAAAVIWSLIAVGVYALLSSVIAAGGLTNSFMGGRTQVPFTVALSPFTPLQAINSSTPIGSHDIPNWVFGVLVAFLLTRLFLLGAAVNMAPLDRRLAANLRFSGLIYTFGLTLLVVYSMAPVLQMTRNMQGNPPDTNLILTNIAIVWTFWMVLGTPYFACYGKEGSKRFWLNGRFSIRHALDGTPAGGLPYMLLLYVFSYGGVLIGAHYVLKMDVAESFWKGALWPVGFSILNWSIGQLLSSITPALKAARVFTMVIIVFAPLLFYIFLGTVFGQTAPWANPYGNPTSNLWYLLPYAPLTSSDMFQYAWIYGAVMGAVGFLVAMLARSIENRRSMRLASA